MDELSRIKYVKFRWELWNQVRYIALLFLLCIGLVAGLFFTTDVMAASYAVQRQTGTGGELATGAIVVVDRGDVVRQAGQDEGQRVFGAVAALAQGLVPTGSVGIISSGVAPVLVSDLGGDINIGDQIALSSIQGVGMKSQTSGWIIGIAQADFASSKHKTVRQQTVTADGASRSTSIKELPVSLSTSYYNPGLGSVTASSSNPVMGVLEKIAGRTVPTTRAILVLTIFAVAVLLLVAMSYAAVKSSILSIGRNPHALPKIITTLIMILGIAVLIIIVTLFVIRAILIGGAGS